VAEHLAVRLVKVRHGVCEDQVVAPTSEESPPEDELHAPQTFEKQLGPRELLQLPLGVD
jgi:hypothetical protein